MASVERLDPRAPLRVVEQVTPERARQLMQRTRENRPVKVLRVDQYAGAMKRGEWYEEAGEPIYIARDGALMNGQHRLLAVIKAKKTVGLPFVYDAPENVYAIADSGAKRSFGDTLHIMGVQNSRALAALIGLLMQYEQRGRLVASGGYVDPTNLQRIAYYKKQDPQELQDAVLMGRKLQRALPPTTTSTGSVLFVLLRRVDRESADSFLEAVRTGAGQEEGSAVLGLRRALQNLETRRHKGAHASQQLVAALYIKAFNFWRVGQSVQALVWAPNKGEKFPTIDPPVEG